MKRMTNQTAIEKRNIQPAKRVFMILPTAWEVAEWNMELVFSSPGCDDRSHLIDCELMNYSKKDSELSIRLFEPDPAAFYSIEAVERLAQTPRRTILRYCRHGLVSPVTDPEFGGYYFDREAIRILQRIGYLQASRGINLAGIKFILELMGEIQRLQATRAAYPLATELLNS
jgi:MerR HTH family regulatory protein